MSAVLLADIVSLRTPPVLSAARPLGVAPRAQFAHAARVQGKRAAIALSRTNSDALILAMVRHDVAELASTISSEFACCARAVHRVVVDSVPRPPRDDELPLASHGTTLAGGLARRRRREPVRLGTHAHECASWRAERGALGREAIARVGGVLLAQRARLTTHIRFYVHWRRPILLWYLWREAEDGLRPLSPLLSPLSKALSPVLVPTLAMLSNWLQPPPPPSARGWAGALALHSAFVPFASTTPLPELEAAILHMRPQIVAKIRHAIRSEPASIGTFLPLMLRLLVLVPLLQLAWRCGARLAPLSALLQARGDCYLIAII
jgi:hypothetical protein